jgi:signal transduction histidine kinase
MQPGGRRVGGRDERASPVPRGAWWWLLVVSAVIVVAYVAVRPAGAHPRWLGMLLYLLAIVLGLAAIVLGVVRYRPGRPVAWWLLAAGYVVALVGEGQDQLLPPTRFPSAKDTVFLLSYALFIAGFLVMARARIASRRGGLAVLDSLIVTVAVLLLCCRFLIFPALLRPYLDNPAVSGAGHAAAVAYLVADLLLLATAVLLIAGGPLRPVPVLLVLVGVGLMVVDDSVSTALMLAGGGPLVVGWLLSYGFGGAAALHPAMGMLTQPVRVEPPSLGAPRIGVLVAITALTPLLLSIWATPEPPVLTCFLVVGVVVLALLVAVRLVGLARALTAQVRRSEWLLDRSVQAQTNERMQVAADLHDGPIQRFTAIELEAETARRRLARGNDAGAGALLDQLTGRLGDEISELRRVMIQLHPTILEQVGFAEALRREVADFERRAGVSCRLRFDLTAPLGAARETILYRVVQEVLTNVAKHAKARRAWVGVGASGSVAELTIRDDGAGFDPVTLSTLVDQRHFGLAGVRNRVELAGGQLTVGSSPGAGTTVTVTLPLPSDAGGRPSREAPASP